MTDEEQKHMEQLQEQVKTLAKQLAETQDALNKAQTANRRLLQDNQSLRYKLQNEWSHDPSLHSGPDKNESD